MRPLTVDSALLGTLPTETYELFQTPPPKINAGMQAAGTAMVGFQPVGGLNTFRLLFMNPAVTEHDVDAVLDLIAEYGLDAINGD